MRTRHLPLPILAVALALAAPRLAAPQQGSVSAPAGAPAGAPSPCASTLTLDSLEGNPDVVTAAANLAAQIVGNYNGDPAKRMPEIGAFWGTFNEKLLEAVHPDCANAKLAQKATTQTAEAKATTSQTNTQTGAHGSGSGATSSAQKVGIPQLLALAVENGAIADSVSGTTMTLSTTPYGFAYAFAKNRDTADRYQSEPVLTHTGISATFNIADTADPLESASRKAVSQWQIKYTFRDTSSRSLAVNCLYLFERTNCWSRTDLDKPPTSKLSAAANAVVRGLSNQEFYTIRSTLQKPENNVYNQAWTSTLQKLVAEPTAEADSDRSQKNQKIGTALLQLLDKDQAFQQALKSYADELNGKSSTLAVLVEDLEANDAAFATAESQFETAVKNLTKGWNGDFTFSQQFPSPSTTTSSTTVSPPAYLAPELDITFDPKALDSKALDSKSDSAQKAGAKAGAGTSGAHAVPSFTGNFSGGFYPNPNTTLHESTFRGAQAALQFQWSLGGGPFNKVKSAGDESNMTLSFSGSYQRLQENEDQKGKRPDLVTGNVKLEIPISSGVSLPLAISFGNATSQVKGNYVLGNFGISFNLDALAALTKLKQ